MQTNDDSATVLLNNEEMVAAIHSRLTSSTQKFVSAQLVEAHLNANDAVANRIGHVTAESVAAELRTNLLALKEIQRMEEAQGGARWESTVGAELFRLHHLFLIVETDVCRVSAVDKSRASLEWFGSQMRKAPKPPKRVQEK